MPRPPSTAAHAKMLEAAADLLLEAGVPGFTIDKVARRSGVAKTTIYRHFPDRNQLLIAALDEAIPRPSTPDTGSLRGDLLEFLPEVAPIFADRAIRAVFFDLWSAGNRDPEIEKLHRQLLAGRAGPTFTIYERGVARGEISPDIDYAAALEIMEGPYIVRSLTRPESIHDLDLEATVDDIVLLLSPHRQIERTAGSALRS